ncbi:hypothetical protein FLAG1_09879 [Fusarium langsethiae]|uniref:Uncharacterized protein n=1 Tax=Fusarium langsethiae TaxID=179993 RepID=A0A0M9EQ41_FUSLA|nr:hypothetical protein FLAG1_09879 [Fusarium langsethiae]GKU06140.1 unnamed protein product [Fusarium langsethiae]GKU21049.1 unnamed protein product [Fusarium langsethiae]
MENTSTRYCVTIRPPMFGSSTYRPNYYHVPCFAKLANLAYLPHLHRLWPLNRFTWRRADMELNPATKSLFLDGGAEMLLQEFKWRYYSWCRHRAGMENEPIPVEVRLLFHRGIMPLSGTQVPGISTEEQQLLAGSLSPVESNHGDSDAPTWNIFHYYLPDTSIGQSIMTKKDFDFPDILGRWEYQTINLIVTKTDHFRHAIERLSYQPESENFYDDYSYWTPVNRVYDPEKPLPLEMVEWSATV